MSNRSFFGQHPLAASCFWIGLSSIVVLLLVAAQHLDAGLLVHEHSMEPTTLGALLMLVAVSIFAIGGAYGLVYLEDKEDSDYE